VPANKQFQRTVIRRRGRGACASFHYAHAPRWTRGHAAAELRRWAARWLSVLEIQCRYHASTKPIGMNVHQRLVHFAAAGALAMRQSGPPDIWPIFLRFTGMRCSCPRFRRCEPRQSGAALSPVSVSRFLRLPPNNRVNRTAHQRRCACWWVPSSLHSSAAGYAERYASLDKDVP
jgi:hypothetical protein